ncbi:NgoFVII restriction endonuclease [Psychrobacillus sp. OK028]|uniref:NgoFVII family restriction endonuclease n=1 Tax=Psychrobacillus sp. OK028 TaxID=1884359 RepID=UPI000889B632|nr:NgoFVII family restriction endonuclease [Psychrobacillus sp. OK028]SDO03362.1 NgoFVII restriction endonuclease [Psychrobacillus sp. OK028]
MFYNNQSEEQRREYIKLLQTVGSLSNLFSDNEVPYLYYRAAENIFCRSLEAHNLSRGDITFDAMKDKVGIALKTFQHRNGRCVEKIAEFNHAINYFQNESPNKIMEIVSCLRNDRIDLALRITDADEMIYHLVTRKEGSFEIHEEQLKKIDLDTLRLNTTATTAKNIWFSDQYAEYKFSISKSTLYKRFITDNAVATFDVDILDNPFEFLLGEEAKNMYLSHESLEEQYEFVVLPLYSAQDGLVYPKSGLNQWNAKERSGKPRHEDEVYIPIPSWIHNRFEGFFPYDKVTDHREPCTLILPNGQRLSAKVCQGGGKGFMSNPNRELGNWILQTVLQLPPRTLVTKVLLDSIGIDSVVVTKLDDLVFRIDFAETGTYDEFEENNK